MLKRIFFGLYFCLIGDAYADTSCVDGLNSKSKESELISCLKNFAEEIKKSAIPSGIVVASVKSCSALSGGWSNYTDAYGRTIVGAIPNGRFKPEEMEHEVHDFRDYFSGIKRGEERVTLTIPQMPEHRHRIATDKGRDVHDGLGGMARSGTSDYGILQTFENIPDKPGFPTVLGNILESTGSSHSHNNMPPYIALYYCKKD